MSPTAQSLLTQLLALPDNEREAVLAAVHQPTAAQVSALDRRVEAMLCGTDPGLSPEASSALTKAALAAFRAGQINR